MNFDESGVLQTPNGYGYEQNNEDGKFEKISQVTVIST